MPKKKQIRVYIYKHQIENACICKEAKEDILKEIYGSRKKKIELTLDIILQVARQRNRRGAFMISKHYDVFRDQALRAYGYGYLRQQVLNLPELPYPYYSITIEEKFEILKSYIKEMKQ